MLAIRSVSSNALSQMTAARSVDRSKFMPPVPTHPQAVSNSNVTGVEVAQAIVGPWVSLTVTSFRRGAVVLTSRKLSSTWQRAVSIRWCAGHCGVVQRPTRTSILGRCPILSTSVV